MQDAIFQYYGIDLLATAMTLVGIFQLGNRQKTGFIIASIGNIIWLGFGILSESLGILIVNLAIAALNVRGYLRWRAEM